jgi:tetratricopeptide (TPR) repeat protein
MAHEFRKREEEEELIKRYEESLRKNTTDFYDIDCYEIIIDHYMALSKFKKALTAVNSAIEQFPFSTDLLSVKAQVLSHLKQYEEALVLLEMAKNLHPNDIEVYLTIGSVQSLRGKHEEAIAVYEEALGFADENKDELYYNIGLSYQSMEDYDNAIASYKKSIEENIAHEGSLYELAFCLDIIGQLENSLAYYKKFIDEDPYSTAAWYNLGIVCNKLERFEEAIEAYEYALAIDENFASARFNMGNSLMNLEKYNEALEEFKKTMELEGPSPEVYCCIGAAYESLGHYDLGLKYFQKSTKLDPLYDEAIFGAGNCLEKQEKWYQALHFFNKAIKLNNDNAEYWKAAAHAEYKIGNIISSISAYEEASHLDPDDKEIWLNWSFIYFEQGEHEKAIDVMLQGIEEIPNEPDFLYRLAAYLIEAGKFKDAFNYLENALILDFDGHTVLFDFFPKPETQKALFKIIDQYRKEKP